MILYMLIEKSGYDENVLSTDTDYNKVLGEFDALVKDEVVQKLNYGSRNIRMIRIIDDDNDNIGNTTVMASFTRAPKGDD